MSRLMIIYKVLESVYPLLEIDRLEKVYPNMKICGILNCQRGLKKLYKFDLFVDVIDELRYAFNFFEFGNDTVLLDINSAEKIIWYHFQYQNCHELLGAKSN